MPGTIYMVATPIGNLEDITKRALDTLTSVDLILAEDTRVTSKLLNRFDINKPLLSYHQQSPDSRKFEILNLLIQDKNIALVTDAGTPGISDPGGELIQYLLDKEPQIKVVPIPGPSSLTTALSASGIRSNSFIFLGFLPKKGRAKIWKKLEVLNTTIVFFESPYRIVKTLNEVRDVFGEKRVFVARELTKLYETHYRGTASEVLEKLGKNKIKGEIVVIVES